MILTKVPEWTGKEAEQLRKCYRSSLALAGRKGFKKIAFPLLGSGIFGFPKELALRIAAEEIGAYLSTHEDTDIALVFHDKSLFQPDPALLSEVDTYIRNAGPSGQRDKQRDDSFGNMHPIGIKEPCEKPKTPHSMSGNMHPIGVGETSVKPEPGYPKVSSVKPPRQKASARKERDLERFLPNRGAILDESFSEMVLRKIDERGYKKDSECYTKANVDKRLFSRIRSKKDYHPSKTTALALAVALELSLSETSELLGKAGYTLSHSIVSDLIVEYCIREKIYNIFEINELLFAYDQPLLGG